MRTMPNPWLAGVAFVFWSASAVAVPTVDPVTQLQRVPDHEVVYAIAVGKAAEAAKKAGDHETAALYREVLQAPIPTEDVPRYKAWAAQYGDARRAGDSTGLREIGRQVVQHAATAYARHSKTPAAARRPARVAAGPVPWRIGYGDAKLRDAMTDAMALHQRVKIRRAEVAIGNDLPVLYPAFHWLPYNHMLMPALAEWSGQSSAEGIAEHLGDNLLVVLFSLFNVKIYLPDDARVRCCAPEALLTVELAASEEEVELVDVRMAQTDPGVYHIAEPFRASDAVLRHIVAMSGRPHFSVVRLDGVGYRGAPTKPTVAYAVRWGDLELEYGAHSWMDPEAVIR